MYFLKRTTTKKDEKSLACVKTVINVNVYISWQAAGANIPFQLPPYTPATQHKLGSNPKGSATIPTPDKQSHVCLMDQNGENALYILIYQNTIK